MGNSKKLLNQEDAARHLGCEIKFLRNAATSGELPFVEQGGKMMFEIHHLNDWYSSLMLKNPSRKHVNGDDVMLAELCPENGIDLSMTGKTKSAILKNLCSLCENTGLLYNPDDFLQELRKREDISSTAISLGVALVHPEEHDEYLCERPFIAIARTAQPVFFGEQDGKPTDLFFVIASPDSSIHLKILGRLCQAISKTDLLEQLRLAENEQDVRQALSQIDALK